MQGPGWHIDPETLLAVLDDEEVLRAAHAGDPAVEAMICLWSGDTVGAERLLDRLAFPCYSRKLPSGPTGRSG